MPQVKLAVKVDFVAKKSLLATGAIAIRKSQESVNDELTGHEKPAAGFGLNFEGF